MQVSTTLVPLHADPAGHGVQLVRVVLVPPEVNDPLVHSWQPTAWFALHRLSAPHSSQPPASERNVPARQNAHCVAPTPDADKAARRRLTLCTDLVQASRAVATSEGLNAADALLERKHSMVPNPDGSRFIGKIEILSQADERHGELGGIER